MIIFNNGRDVMFPATQLVETQSGKQIYIQLLIAFNGANGAIHLNLPGVVINIPYGHLSVWNATGSYVTDAMIEHVYTGIKHCSYKHPYFCANEKETIFG